VVVEAAHRRPASSISSCISTRPTRSTRSKPGPTTRQASLRKLPQPECNDPHDSEHSGRLPR
jgi:hypothetical protein